MTDLYEESYPPSLWEGTPTPPPTITLLTPASVSLAAMPPFVVITGTGFKPGMQVKVDGVVYPSGAYVSPTSAQFVPDAASAGTQQITVVVDGQTSNAHPLTVTAITQMTAPDQVGSFTIAEVQAFVEANPHTGADVLFHEQARGASARSTLVAWLEAFVEAHTGVDPTP